MAQYTLDGTEKKIRVLGLYVSIKNNSDTVMYAGAAAGVDPGSENVTPIQAGESISVPAGQDKCVYLLGTGNAAIISGNEWKNFFKPAPKGESGGGSGDKITQQQLNDTLKYYATNASVDSKLGSYATSQSLSDGLKGKVDVIAGKGLSENDYTAADKNKLAGLSDYDDSAVKADIAALEADNTANKANIAGLEESKANKSEIPAALPAVGGNADTVGGYTPDLLIQSNPNLLDNPDFKINQRGQSSYTSSGYTVDRWKLEGRALKVTPNDGYIHIEQMATGGNVPFSQPTEPLTFLQDQPMTLSILARGDILFQMTIMTAAGEYNTGWRTLKSDNWTLIAKTAVIPKGETLEAVRICQVRSTSAVGSYIDIQTAKLEYGEQQTLAHQDSNGNWALNDPPPNHALELQKCLWYFEKGKADGLSALYPRNDDWIVQWHLHPKRIKATVTISNFKDNTVPLDVAFTIFSVFDSNNHMAGISLRSSDGTRFTPGHFLYSYEYEASADL